MNAFLIVDTKQAIGGTGSPAPLKETSNQAHRQRRSRDSNLQMQAQASLRGTRHIAAARTQHRMRACVRACVRARSFSRSFTSGTSLVLLQLFVGVDQEHVARHCRSSRDT